MIRNKAGFYGEELPTSRPNPKVLNHPLSAVRDCFYNIFATKIRNLYEVIRRTPRTGN
jgi:hypothetical protein